MKRMIQVGVGGMGTCWTDRLAESDAWEAVAYVDTNPAHLKAAAARHGLPKSRCFATVGEALRRVKADALLDVTPQRFRRGVCEAAIGAGLHVMSEKPLADNLKNAKAIVACAAKHKRIYMVAQNYRYQPVVQTMKRWVSEGRLGAVGYAGVNFHKGPHFGGFREEMAYPLVLDMSIHHVDMMRCIFDADVASVSAVSTGAPWNWSASAGSSNVQSAIGAFPAAPSSACPVWAITAARTSTHTRIAISILESMVIVRLS